jgi:crotonobetainyl-CoA:carnitine CoA-transferase CaiB-like acyl-CoA transferase
MRPLEGCLVLDFSTLLPGPLATLLLAEAGAEVIAIERPGVDQMPALAPLNRGKRRLVLDLKNPQHRDQLQPLLGRADVLVEQFRPGVMRRLGLGYADVGAINPKIVYCSITGYGQDGPKSGVAGHDLNYIAETGLLSMSMGPPSNPVMPPALIADIAGGSYPAVINILLALRERERTGRGYHLDVSMTENVFTMMLGNSVITSGSPRYRLYPTKDGRILAVGALEQRFWDAVCEITGLDADVRDDRVDPAKTTARLSAIVAGATAETWARRMAGRDCCCSIVATVEEALADPHFRARGISPSHVPIAAALRGMPS